MSRIQNKSSSAPLVTKNKTIFFTIVSRSYLSFAFVLAQNLNRHHPEAEVCIWLMDEGQYPPPNCNARFRNVSETYESDELASLRIYYSVLEFATSIKPRLMQMHLDEGAQNVIYLDPDIAVFQPMEQVFDLLNGGASAVFTPHITQPLPADGRMPNDWDILTSGTYNLGFLAVSACPEVDAFLAWWEKWLKTHCFADKAKGVFTDQKWAELGPSLLKAAKILHDPGYNVAYWNLHYRKLAQAKDEWTVNGHKLCFFHFSGFNPKTPAVLSKHQDRFEKLPEPVARLFEWYATTLREAGYETILKLPPPDARFSNGAKVDVGVRAQFQDLTLRGRQFVAPLDANGAFYQWLLRPVNGASHDGSPVITNYLKGIHDVFSDLQRAFPDVMGHHKQPFLDWVRTTGFAERELSKPLVFHKLAPVYKKPFVPQPEPNGRVVSYYGYLGSRLGIGEAARGNIVGLRSQGLEVQAMDLSHFSPSETGEWNGEPASAYEAFSNSKVNIIHVNADQLPVVREMTGLPSPHGYYNIGVWAWETLKFPEIWFDRFALLDEIWVGGSIMAKAIAEVSPIPVVHMPHVVKVPRVQPDRKRFGIAAEETVFPVHV
ncbi:MAG: hypothetical protein WDN00_11970 [Limisphaerales bacterium]